MKEKMIALIAICLLTFPLSLLAQEKPLKIGIINSNRVINESIEGKKFLNFIRKTQQEKQAEIEAMEKKLLDDKQQFQRQMNSLSDEARIRKQTELNRRETDLKRFTEDADVEMRAILNEKNIEIQKKIFPVIRQLATEKGYSLILEANAAMLYIDSSVDITDEVIARFDQAASAPSKPSKK